MSWWDDSKEELPANGQEVHNTVHSLDILDFSIFTLGWMEHASGNELGAPGLLLVLVDFGNELSVSISFFLLLHVSNNVDLLQCFLAQFGSGWRNVKESQTESIITVFVSALVGIHDLDFESLFDLVVCKGQSSTDTFEVSSIFSNEI